MSEPRKQLSLNRQTLRTLSEDRMLDLEGGYKGRTSHDSIYKQITWSRTVNLSVWARRKMNSFPTTL